MPSEISKHREVFGVAYIVDDQSVVRTTGFSPNNVSEARIINSMTPISIQTWHRRMGHLGYQNLIRLPKIADGIEIKDPIPAEICGDFMKGRQQRKPSYEPMSTSSEYLDDLHCDLGRPYPITRRGVGKRELHRLPVMPSSCVSIMACSFCRIIKHSTTYFIISQSFLCL